MDSAAPERNASNFCLPLWADCSEKSLPLVTPHQANKNTSQQQLLREVTALAFGGGAWETHRAMRIHRSETNLMLLMLAVCLPLLAALKLILRMRSPVITWNRLFKPHQWEGHKPAKEADSRARGRDEISIAHHNQTSHHIRNASM